MLSEPVANGQQIEPLLCACCHREPAAPGDDFCQWCGDLLIMNEPVAYGYGEGI